MNDPTARRSPSRPVRARLGLWLACALAAAGCGACKTSVASHDAGPTDVSPDWLEGRLPEDTASPPATAAGTLVVRAMSEPGGLNFLDDRFRDAWTSRMTRNLVFESLLEIDPVDYTLKPQLAESWTESADHRITTLTLRQGVTFHDGTPFTVRDVLAVLTAVQEPARPTASLRSDFVELSSFRAVGERTLELKWRTPSPFALRQLARLPIYPAAALTRGWEALAERPVGTGPFKVSSWERGQALTLERHPGWWGGQVYLERIVFRVVKDHTVAAALFEKGAFDLMTNIQPGLWREMEAPAARKAWARRGLHRIRSMDNSYSYVAWNEAFAPFADVRVRRALAHLYPAELVSKAVDLGLELPTTCPFYLPSARCDPAVEPLSFSPDAARAELLDAGYADTDGDGVLDRDGVALRFHFLMPARSVRLGKLAPLLQEQLAPVGIDLVVEKVDGSTLSARLAKRDFEVVSRVWTEFDAEQDLYQIFHSSQVQAGSNFIGYRNDTTDRLLEQMRAEWDAGARDTLGRQLHRQLYADQPYLFMTVRQSLDASQQRVHGLRPSLLWYDLRRVWVSP